MISLMDRMFVRRWGFSPLGLKCKARFVVNRLARLCFKYLHRELYEKWNWFEKPLSLRNCMFICKDGIVFKGYDADAMVASASHEPFFIEVLEKVLHEDSVFVDVGAHIGGFTLRAAKTCNRGLVVAFEPDPRNYYYLVQNIMINNVNNVVALALALSGAWKLVEFSVSKHSVLSSTTDLHKDSTLFKTMVLAAPLDGVAEIMGLSRVDAIKIDVEGAEVEVVKGATRTLQHYKPVLLIEIHGEEQYKQVMRYLRMLGYETKVVRKSPLYEWHKHVVAYTRHSGLDGEGP